MPSLAGHTIGKYDVIEEVGHGGMAVVYRGHDRVLDRDVAVKVLHPHLADREESRERLRREALTVAKLQHDNIVEIYDYSGESADESYIVTEFIHGRTLREWIDTEWQPHPLIAALIIHRLCLALVHAHAFGVVHRDIKPENVMIRRDGCLKLMDFGIAQILDHQKLTMTGQLLGSPSYMAPELISGKPVDARTDLFAVGIMLYQLSTGTLPFAGRNPHEVLNRIADAQYTRPSEICPRVDEELESIIEKALARNPSERFQTARAFARELDDYLGRVDFEPSETAIRKYFDAPESFVDELDKQTCKILLDQAESIARDGRSARSLRILSRVLELDPDNSRARSMLDRARIRGQRMRQLLFGGASLAVVGLVAAGWIMMRDPSHETEGALAAHAKKLPAHTQSPDLMLEATPEDTAVPIAIAPVSARAPNDEAETSRGSTRSPKKMVARTETLRRRGLKTEASSVRRRPHLPARSRLRKCAIKVEDLPLALGRHHRISVAGQPDQTLDSDLTTDLTVIEPTRVRLVGKRYGGSLHLKPADCGPGAVVVLRAKPRAASLKFTASPEGLSIECIFGCPTGHSTYTRDNFPDLPVPTSANVHEWQVKLRFRAPGFRQRTTTLQVQPGPNSVSASLKRAK